MYKAWMVRDSMIALFEQTVADVDSETGDQPLAEKNRVFLAVYESKLKQMKPTSKEELEKMTEERHKQLFDGREAMPKPSLEGVRQLLAQAMAALDEIERRSV
jgi:hypothetical protein